MKTKKKANSESRSAQTSVAQRIAGEDLRKGDFVSILSEVYELPSFLWGCSGEALPAAEPVRLQFISRTSGTPYKVKNVCLPFVYTDSPTGEVKVLDVRRHSLVRIDRGSGRQIWSALSRKSST